MAPRTTTWSALAVLAVLATATSAHVDPSRGTGGAVGSRTDWPCTGCLTFAPSNYETGTGWPDDRSQGWPLVVALHGDEGDPAAGVIPIWRGMCNTPGANCLLLAPMCPRDLGCTGSWWRWPGANAAWLLAQIDAVMREYDVESTRVYVTGWSGGATFLAPVSADLAPRIAALALQSGGMPPSPPTCAAGTCRMPVWYLFGTADSLYPLGTAARDYFEGCGNPVTWIEIPGGGHMDTIGMLAPPTARAAEVLRFFYDHPNTCLGAAGSTDAGASALDAGGVAPGIDAGRASDAGSASARDAAGPYDATATGGCGCRVGADAPVDRGLALLLPALASALVAHRRRVRRRSGGSAP